MAWGAWSETFEHGTRWGLIECSILVVEESGESGPVGLTVPPRLSPNSDPKQCNLGLYNINGRLIYSGDVITLVTVNPETHPLPDMRIMEMRWFMNRVVAMSGLAEREGIYQTTRRSMITAGPYALFSINTL